MAGDALVVVRGIAVLIGIGIFLASYRIRRWIAPVRWEFLEYNASGWLLLGLSGVSLAGSSGLALVAGRLLPAQTYIIEGLGFPLFSILLSLALTCFVDSKPVTRRPAIFTTRNTALFLAAVVAAVVVPELLTAGITPRFFTLLYTSSLLLLLPAIWAAIILRNDSRVPIWTAFLLGSAVMYASAVLDSYAAAFCGPGGSFTGQELCARYAYTLYALPVWPDVEPLIFLATAGLVVATAALLVLGFGVLLFYRHIYVPAGGSSGNQAYQIQQLIDGTVATLGSLIGKPVAETIAENTIENAFDDIQVSFRDDGKTVIQLPDTFEAADRFDEVKAVLIDGFSDTIGPVAEREINAVADSIHRPSDTPT